MVPRNSEIPPSPLPLPLGERERVRGTPASIGFSMPAEWERQEATWLAWPHNLETWPGRRLAEVEGIYLRMLEYLLPGEKVHLLVNDAAEEEKVLKLLQKSGIASKNLVLHQIPTVDTWIRDYGPTFLVKKGNPSPFPSPLRGEGGVREKAFVKWIFNAWGGKYPTLAEDTHVFGENSSLVSQTRFEPGVILEGGSIEVNGRGTCLTTEQCLLNPNRNPGLSRSQIEKLLKDYLGVRHIVWLEEGIVGDDTDGHIDDIARFIDPNTIVAAYEEDERDQNHPILKKNGGRLHTARDQDDRQWNVVKLPMPGVVMDEVRLPASYANFSIGNEVVLLPVYGHPNDDRAQKILEELFPDRLVVPILCRALVYGLGAIHCVSQQEPAC